VKPFSLIGLTDVPVNSGREVTHSHVSELAVDAANMPVMSSMPVMLSMSVMRFLVLLTKYRMMPSTSLFRQFQIANYLTLTMVH
jgi:hypothetical protein